MHPYPTSCSLFIQLYGHHRGDHIGRPNSTFLLLNGISHTATSARNIVYCWPAKLTTLYWLKAKQIDYLHVVLKISHSLKTFKMRWELSFESTKDSERKCSTKDSERKCIHEQVKGYQALQSKGKSNGLCHAFWDRWRHRCWASRNEHYGRYFHWEQPRC